MCPLAAHGHVGLGMLSRYTVRPHQAHGALTLAADLYRALDMPFYLACADRVLTGGTV